MAKAPTSTPSAPGNDPAFKANIPATIDPEATYEVTLWRATPFAGRQLRPDQLHSMSGAALETVKDSVLAAIKAT